MTTAREEILGNIRRVLKDRPNDLMRGPEKQVVPARGQIPHAAQIDLFIAEIERVNATTIRVDRLAEVPSAVATFLVANNLPSEVRAGQDTLIKSILWSNHTALTINTGTAQSTDQASVTSAFAGVAETGSLALISGADSPTSLNFLPDNHIVILRTETIVGAYEEVWRQLREQRGGDWPRTVNLITGPSRTADIEQDLLLGAHGPRQLHVVLVDEKAK
jgi:L-lactate dehydrogenase complex protein LldG